MTLNRSFLGIWVEKAYESGDFFTQNTEGWSEVTGSVEE